MLDGLLVLLVVIFFGLSWGFVRLCESCEASVMTALTWVGLVIALALLMYLFAALLKPELFE
jgi:K+-transporting ATPase KdpF subunit